MTHEGLIHARSTSAVTSKRLDTYAKQLNSYCTPILERSQEKSLEEVFIVKRTTDFKERQNGTKILRPACFILSQF